MDRIARQKPVEWPSDKPLPWELDDGDPKTHFDAEIRAKTTRAIDQLKGILQGKGYSPNSREYKEKLAVGLFYFTDFPDDVERLRKHREQALQLTRELDEVGLAEFRNFLFESGGLDAALMNEDAPIEATALEALQMKKGWCTEKSKILFGVYEMAVLDPRFVKTSMRDVEKTLDPENVSVPQEKRMREHIYIAVPLGENFRFFDLSIFNSNARYPNSSFFSLNQYLSVDQANLAASLENQGKDMEAMVAVLRAMRLDPKNPGAHSNLANLLEKQGDLDKTLTYDKAAVKLSPDSPALYYNLGVTLGKQGKLKQALEAFEMAIQMDPRLAAAHANLGIALAGLGDLDGGLEALKKAHEHDPTNEEIKEFLDWVQREKWDKMPWSEHFDKAVTFWMEHKENEAMGQLRLVRGKVEKALMEDTDKVDAFKKELEEKVKTLPPTMKKNRTALKDLIDTLRRVHGVYYGRSEFQQSIAVCQLEIQLAPNDPNVYWDLYKSYQQMGDISEALKACLQYKKLTKQAVTCP